MDSNLTIFISFMSSLDLTSYIEPFIRLLEEMNLNQLISSIESLDFKSYFEPLILLKERELNMLDNFSWETINTPGNADIPPNGPTLPPIGNVGPGGIPLLPAPNPSGGKHVLLPPGPTPPIPSLDGPLPHW